MSECLSCGAAGRSLGYSTRQPLAECSACGLVFAEAWNQAFNTIHEDVYAQHNARDYEYDPLNLARLDLLLSDAERGLAGKRLLDVGCGHGDLVFAARRQGWDAQGIDLAPSAIALCQKKGLPCTQMDFFASTLDAERFDFITMSEFIEHVPTPIRFLARARELLKPSGLVYVTTPNFGSLSRRLLLGDWPPIHPEHVSYFTPKTLARAATSAGLKVVRLETRNLSMAVPAKLRSRLTDLVGRRAGPSAAPVGAASAGAGAAPLDATQQLRRRIAGSRVLTRSRDLVNAALNATGTGESLFGWFQAD